MIAYLALLIFAAPATGFPPNPLLVLQPDVQLARSGLLQALRIQQVPFRVVDTSMAVPLEQETSPVFQLLDTHAALLAVWTERRESALLLHMAGRRAGKPFVDQMRFEAQDEPAIDRAFALKIRDVLDELMIARLSLSLPDAGPPPRVAARPVTDPADPGDNPALPRGTGGHRGPDWVIELGGRGMDSRGNGSGHMAVVLSGARQARVRRGAVEAYTELTLAPETTITSRDGEMTTSTIEGMLGLRALAMQRPESRLGGGAYLGAGAWLARARGTTPQGATGTARRIIPTLAAGLEGRARINSRLAVRVAIGGALSLRRHRFALNEIPIADLGRYRAQGQLSLLLSLP